MKKIVSLLLVMVLAFSLFAGCGKKEEPSTPETTAPESSAPAESKEESKEEKTETEETVHLTFSLWDLVNDKYYEDLVAKFEEQNPNITIEIYDIPSDDYTSKLNVELNGGSAADIILVKDADTIFDLSAKGQLADLTEYISRDGMDLGQFNGLAENFNFDGKQVGLPFRTDFYVLYYNKDIFDAAGVDYPSNDMTWAEFEALAEQITAGEGADKKYGAFLHTWQACVQNWAVQEGEHTIMGPDYEFMKPAYEMALRMQDAGTIQEYATLQSSKIHYSSPFQLGNVGMLPMGSWFISTMIQKTNEGETDVNWGVATLPHPESVSAGTTVGSTTPIVVNGASEHIEAAWEFLSFVVSEEGTTIMAEAGKLPGNLNDDMLKIITSVDGMPEGTLEALQVEQIYLDRPIVEYVNEVNQMLGEEHDMIMLEEQPLDDVLATMSERSKEIQGIE